jgi:hypothetical protein
MRHRRKPDLDPYTNHYQRLHEHSTRGAERADPQECACAGSGWILSSCDVWAKCSRHYDGQPRPDRRPEKRPPGNSTEGDPKYGYHEFYIEKCRATRIDDPSLAHAEALVEKRRRDERRAERDGGKTVGAERPPAQSPAGGEGPELPF